jgi:hypothetical protein
MSPDPAAHRTSCRAVGRSALTWAARLRRTALSPAVAAVDVVVRFTCSSPVPQQWWLPSAVNAWSSALSLLEIKSTGWGLHGALSGCESTGGGRREEG